MSASSAPPEPTRRQLPGNAVAASLRAAAHARGPSSRSGTATPTTGSATQTLTNASPRESQSPEPSLILRLRGAHNLSETETTRSVTWADNVVDNEGLGRKSSKVCCIYHKPRGDGESSSEEDSSDSDNAASDSADDGTARPVGGKGKGKRKDCGHGHDHSHNHERRKPSPNAYERQPKPRPAKT